MRILISYDTEYVYESELRAAIQLLRVEPRSDAAQRISRWRVQVDAPGRLRRGEDAFGNVLHAFYLDGRTDRLRVHVEGEAETVDTAGVLSGAPERFPPAVFLRDTGLTAPDPAIEALAQEAAAVGGDRLARLHALLGIVADRVRFDTGGTGPSTTAAQALQGGHGVCQDMAHIFIAAAHRLGAPARYVSGHLLRTETPAQEAGHAWAEAYVEDLGWVGFDPANRRSPTEAYVRVAAGPDYLAAAPVRGSRSGGDVERMTVRLVVEEAKPERRGRAERLQIQSQSSG